MVTVILLAPHLIFQTGTSRCQILKYLDLKDVMHRRGWPGVGSCARKIQNGTLFMECEPLWHKLVHNGFKKARQKSPAFASKTSSGDYEDSDFTLRKAPLMMHLPEDIRESELH